MPSSLFGKEDENGVLRRGGNFGVPAIDSNVVKARLLQHHDHLVFEVEAACQGALFLLYEDPIAPALGLYLQGHGLF